MTEVGDRGELPLYRLYVMRAAYVVVGLVQGAKTWPAILHPARPWDFWHGIAMSFFGALTLLCLLGLRYPVRMMPLLIFEFVWKAIWVLAAWLPPWLGHTLDPDIADSFVQIFPGVVIVPLMLPWGYIWKHYVLGAGRSLEMSERRELRYKGVDVRLGYASSAEKAVQMATLDPVLPAAVPAAFGSAPNLFARASIRAKPNEQNDCSQYRYGPEQIPPASSIHVVKSANADCQMRQ